MVKENKLAERLLREWWLRREDVRFCHRDLGVDAEELGRFDKLIADTAKFLEVDDANKEGTGWSGT